MDGIPIWLDGIPIYWTEFRSDWTESGTDWTEFRPDWTECCQSVDAGKKSAWTDLDRVGFEKIFQSVNVQIEKLAWTGLGKVKRKASSAASVFNFLQDWSPGVRRSVLHFDGLPLTRGAVVATPFAAAVSLTFSLVKNLQMLLQAKRQPG